jgi:hypothetical protein
MAIVLRFSTTGFSADKYAETLKRLEQAGAGSPPGRLYHVCFGDKDNLRVSDIWESQEAFDKFKLTLKPILDELGIDPGTPEVLEVHNLIAGSQAAAGGR